MNSKSLQLFLLRPLEFVCVAAVLLAVLKIISQSLSAVIHWWMIGALIFAVPILFFVFFAVVYLLTWLFGDVE